MNEGSITFFESIMVKTVSPNIACHVLIDSCYFWVKSTSFKIGYAIPFKC
jgi:hypothetical protein